MEQRGFILIADITGYTAYLNQSELEHAQGTLTDLLELLIDHTERPLIISRLEGDAVISYGLESGFLSGQTLLETIETTYIDFRKAIELMVLNNTCQCNACANVSSLDLKFFVHFGSFVLQKLGDHDELLGTDVNLIHRLLKNSVTADTGIRAYLLCTDAAFEALGIDASGAVVHHTESVPDFGEASMWIMDMAPVYEVGATDDRLELEPNEVIGTLTVDSSLPQHVVWDYMSDPGFRKVLLGSDRQEITDLKAGRVTTGTSYQCFHGDKSYSQVVLEWKPFERVVVEQSLELPGGPATMLLDYQLTPIDGGTRLTSTAARLSGKGLRRVLWKSMVKAAGRRSQQQLTQFRDHIEADVERRQSAGSAPKIDVRSITESAAGAVAQWNAGPRQESKPHPAGDT
jgi:hypothetical protein